MSRELGIIGPGGKRITVTTEGSKERLDVSIPPITVTSSVILGEGNTRFFKHLTNGPAIAGTITNTKDQTFAFTDGDILKVKVDGGSEQTATFNTGDFVDINSATAAEVVTVLNTDITGQTASVIGLKVKIISNTTGILSSIEVTGGAGNLGATKLQFPINFSPGDDGSPNMNINSESAVTLFSISADSTIDTFIEKINIIMEDSSIAYDKFGGIPELRTGIELFFDQTSIRKNIIEIAQTNADIAHFLNSTGTEILASVSGNVFIATISFPQTIHLVAGSVDKIIMRIQDDLSLIDSFVCFVEGFTRT